MSHAEYSHHPVEWRVQPDAVLNQAAPVQNTWYTVLTTLGYTFIDFIVLRVQTANESLGLQIIVDGITKNASIAAVAGTSYVLAYGIDPTNANLFSLESAAITVSYARLMGHAVTVRIRKTTALGAGNLQCLVKYSVV